MSPGRATALFPKSKARETAQKLRVRVLHINAVPTVRIDWNARLYVTAREVAQRLGDPFSYLKVQVGKTSARSQSLITNESYYITLLYGTTRGDQLGVRTDHIAIRVDTPEVLNCRAQDLALGVHRSSFTTDMEKPTCKTVAVVESQDKEGVHRVTGDDGVGRRNIQ